jgi:hypothetical protein
MSYVIRYDRPSLIDMIARTGADWSDKQAFVNEANARESAQRKQQSMSNIMSGVENLGQGIIQGQVYRVQREQGQRQQFMQQVQARNKEIVGQLKNYPPDIQAQINGELRAVGKLMFDPDFDVNEAMRGTEGVYSRIESTLQSYEPPQPPKTWDEYKEAGIVIERPDGGFMYEDGKGSRKYIDPPKTDQPDIREEYKQTYGRYPSPVEEARYKQKRAYLDQVGLQEIDALVSGKGSPLNPMGIPSPQAMQLIQEEQARQAPQQQQAMQPRPVVIGDQVVGWEHPQSDGSIHRDDGESLWSERLDENGKVQRSLVAKESPMKLKRLEADRQREAAESAAEQQRKAAEKIEDEIRKLRSDTVSDYLRSKLEWYSTPQIGEDGKPGPVKEPTPEVWAQYYREAQDAADQGEERYRAAIRAREQLERDAMGATPPPAPAAPPATREQADAELQAIKQAVTARGGRPTAEEQARIAELLRIVRGG